MITAKEAKLISDTLTVDEHLAVIEKYIIRAAESKLREVIIRDTPYCWWLYSSMNVPINSVETITKLKENGYTVHMHYQENQFVDIGLVISW